MYKYICVCVHIYMGLCIYSNKQSKKTQHNTPPKKFPKINNAETLLMSLNSRV